MLLKQSTMQSNIFIKSIYARRSPKARKRKTADHLRSIYESTGKIDCSLPDLRAFAMMVVSYAGFLRYSEIADLRRWDIEIHDTHMTLFIESSKTDIYRIYIVHWRLIAKIRLKSIICPVQTLLAYLERTGITNESTEYIFRRMT